MSAYFFSRSNSTRHLYIYIQKCVHLLLHSNKKNEIFDLSFIKFSKEEKHLSM